MAVESTTTIAVYTVDRAWLQKRQREVSFQREKTVTMPDLLRELIRYVKDAETGAE